MSLEPSGRPRRREGKGEFRLRARPQSRLEQIEERIDVAEAQLEGMRKVRASIGRQALPTVVFVGVLSFGVMGWGPTDPLPVAVGGVLLSLLALLGVGAHFGIRRSERRLAELDEELALSIGRERSSEDRADRRIEDGGDAP